MSDLGGADPKLLVAAGRTGDGAVTDGDPSPWDKEWHTTFEKWNATRGSLVILIFSTHPGISARPHNCAINNQFGFTVKHPESGVYLVGKSPTGNGWKLPSTGNNYKDYCKEIYDAGFDELPTIVIGVDSSKIMFLPRGINCEDGGLLIPSSKTGSPFNDVLLSAELQEFADKNLVAPELRKDLWEDAYKYWPTELAEKTIQKFLLIYLRAVFKKFEFLAEPPVVAGRIDICILPGSAAESGRSILELKAVRQFSSTGNSYSSKGEIKKLKEGIEQAQTYFKEATHKYLCAYDMREKKDASVFNEVLMDCKKVGVELRTYVVHHSSSSIRSSIASSMSPKD